MAYPPPLRPDYYTPPSRPPAGMAVASMVCGILSICLLCVLWPVSLPLSIVAVVLGGKAQREVRLGVGGGRGMANAGVTCGSITLLLFAVAVLLLVCFGLIALFGGR